MIIADPSYAANYLRCVKTQLDKENVAPNKCKSSLWKSAKSPTEEDHKATVALLSLRQALNNNFNDKKTHKNQLWQTIANELNRQGFFVGEGMEAREKVHLKFTNLQSSYIKFCDLRRQTGQGKLKPPKYFDELHLILGDKHKVNPVLIFDTADHSPSTSLVDNSEGNTSNSNKSDVSEQFDLNCSEARFSKISTSDTSGQRNVPNVHKHRFENVKTSVKPKSAQNTTLKELVNIQRESQSIRKEEFIKMITLFQEQNNQRHDQIMALIAQMDNRQKKNRKRTREASVSSGDSD